MIARTCYWLLPMAFLVSRAGNAQKSSDLEKDYEFALTLFYEEYYPDALEQFLQIAEVDANYEDIPYRIETLHFMAGDYERPLDTLLAYADSYGAEDKFYHYWLGQVFAKKYLFSEAISSWRTFLDMSAYKSPEIVEETRQFIEKAEKSIAFFSAQGEYKVRELPTINTLEDERHPVKIGRGDLAYLHTEVNDAGEEITEIRLRADDSSHKQLFSNIEFSVRGFGAFGHGGPGIYLFDAKGSTMKATAKGTSWTRPEDSNLKIPKSKNGMEIFLSSDEQLAFFISSKGYSKNGTDIYYMRKDPSGKWQRPEALPPHINTLKNQRSPYFDESTANLYFSSDGFESVGGYDVFKVQFDSTSGSWGQPQQLPYPVNTPQDELDFVIGQDGIGYFSSNRLYSKGGLDIYQAQRLIMVDVNGQLVSDDGPTAGGTPKRSITFEPLNYVGDMYQVRADEDGTFKAKLSLNDPYLVSVFERGRIIYEDTLLLADLSEKSQVEVVIPQKASSDETEQIARTRIAAGEIEELDETDIFRAQGKSYFRKGAAVGENIYYEFGVIDKSKGSEETFRSLVELLKANPEETLEISGYTDNVGPADANLWVSRRRAMMVKKLLVQRGINPERLVTTGYGERFPIASNDDEKEGREFNRRIEFYLVKSFGN